MTNYINYIEETKKFLKNTGTKIKIVFKETKLNPWDEQRKPMNTWNCNIYRVTIKRNGKQYSFNFTDSYNNYLNGNEPSEYDVLACLQKYDVGSYDDFCSEFGYEKYAEYYRDADKNGYNKRNYKIYKAVTKEAEKVQYIFSDVIDELREIC